MAVAARLGVRPTGHESLDDLGEERTLPREPRAVRSRDAVVVGLRVGEGVELEGPDQARVQALEVEHRHALEDPGA